MDWRHDAACRDEDPELFFPVGTSGPALSQVAQAKAICHRCPSASDCLAWALASGQDAGVWGGMSEDERRALKRRRTHIGSRSPAADNPKPPEDPKRPTGSKPAKDSASDQGHQGQAEARNTGGGAKPAQGKAQHDRKPRTSDGRRA